jgi:hypothetical protein
MLRSRGSIGTGRSNGEDLEAQLGFGTEKNALKSRRGATMGLARRQFVSLRHTWRLLPASSKVIVFMFSSFLIIHVVLGTLDVWFHYYGLGGSGDKSDALDMTSFAVVINTYRRPRMLQEAVTHYADSCGKKFGVSQVCTNDTNCFKIHKLRS